MEHAARYDLAAFGELPRKRAVFTGAIDVQGLAFRSSGAVEDTSTGARNGDAFDAGECADDGRLRFLVTFVGIDLPPKV